MQDDLQHQPPAWLCDSFAVIQCQVEPVDKQAEILDMQCDVHRICWFTEQYTPNDRGNPHKRMKMQDDTWKLLPSVTSDQRIVERLVRMGQRPVIAGVCVTGLQENVDKTTLKRYPDTFRRVVVKIAGEVFVKQHDTTRLAELIPGHYATVNPAGDILNWDKDSAHNIVGMIGAIDPSVKNPGVWIILTPQARVPNDHVPSQRVRTREDVIEDWLDIRQKYIEIANEDNVQTDVALALQRLEDAINADTVNFNPHTAKSVRSMVLNSDMSQGTTSTNWEWPDPSHMSTYVMESILTGDKIGPTTVVGLKNVNGPNLNTMLKAMQRAPRPMGQIESEETAVLLTKDDQECTRRWLFACKSMAA